MAIFCKCYLVALTAVFLTFFPALIQAAQTKTFSPSTRRACRFTFWRRLVAICEWLRLTLVMKPRLQLEHCRAI